jgi:hypothetical protein
VSDDAAAGLPAADPAVRLPELMLLMAEHLQSDPTYGATKLNEALFFADHLHYKRHGASISGATYERLPLGTGAAVPAGGARRPGRPGRGGRGDPGVANSSSNSEQE